MSVNLPYALGCPSCTHHVVVSEVDPDASLSDLSNHIFDRHAGYNRAETNKILAGARELTRAQVNPMTDTIDIRNTPFEVAHRLAPVPNESGTTEDWIRFHAAQALAAWTVFDRDVKHLLGHPTQGGRPEIGYLAGLGVASTHAAVTPACPDETPAILWQLTPEAGALNGELEGWIVDMLDRLGINPADINDQYVAADFRCPTRVEVAA